MAHEDHVAQVLVVEQLDDVADVVVEVDRRVQEVGALGQARERRGVDLMAGGAEPASHLLVTPPAVPATVHEYERRHGRRNLPLNSRRSLYRGVGRESVAYDRRSDEEGNLR